ncbi:MAG: mechanosensitive ion channel [Acidimicrobiales bacterium]|nr:mechanosensitive ion channel [Acidimicrobiales bacterium]MCB1018154.1 mechanosensitive ion channel [Acidimicrobiales bacterium]
MPTWSELFADSGPVAGRLAASVLVVVAAVLLAVVVARLVASRVDDATNRYHTRKAIRYAVAVLALVALAVVWRPFAGRIGVVVGFATAGVAFAMQEAIGAVAGWINIVSGRIFSVGDRIQMAGVRGDVIDITPLRTKVMEMGSARDDDTWVQGRQYTGRIVAISNKATFTEPVFNYSSAFEYIWEELTVPVPHDADVERAEAILLDEVRRASSDRGAERAMREMTRRYPIARADVEARVFVRATDNWTELAARFVLPVRSARRVKDEVTRRVLDRFASAGIEIASETQDVTVTGRSAAVPDEPAVRRGDGG